MNKVNTYYDNFNALLLLNCNKFGILVAKNSTISGVKQLLSKSKFGFEI